VRNDEVRTRNVQRYGAQLQRQLDAIKLAREQVKALAAAGKGAGDSADNLTAIAVQLIQQQVLSTLLQTAQPKSSDQPETADGDAKTLEVRDLQRLTRITVDLNRVTNGRQKCARKAAHTGHAAVDEASAKPKQKGLSEKTYHMIRNALLTRHPVEAYFGDYSSDEPDTTPKDPVATPAAPAEAPAESTQPVADSAPPAEARQSSSELTLPQLPTSTRTTSCIAFRSTRLPTGLGPGSSFRSSSVIPGPRSGSGRLTRSEKARTKRLSLQVHPTRTKPTEIHNQFLAVGQAFQPVIFFAGR
jgi:Protein of unknown function (DUF3486)